MGLFEMFGLGAARAGDARAPKLAPPESFFAGEALELLNAARAGDEPRVRALVAHGADPNSHGPASTSKAVPQLSLLNYVTYLQDARAASLLIAHGADPLAKAREEDGNAFLFPIVRGDAQGLDMLYQVFPLSRVPPDVQASNAFSALNFHCRPCLEVMFRRGLPTGVEDPTHYSLFMMALLAEELDTAEWLLVDVKVPLTAQTVRGVTAPNMVQKALTETYKPGTPTWTRYQKFRSVMEERGIRFPVETAAQVRERLHLK
jgi:hypothetical protein